MKNHPEKKIASIIRNQSMAHDLVESMMNVPDAMTKQSLSQPWTIFNHSLDSAIRDIWNDKRGPIFKRLLEFGPHNPDVPEKLESDNMTFLSDPECGTCVEFIFSHMVNRFKGELAELLAIKPLTDLVNQLKSENRLPDKIMIYRGDEIKEKRHLSKEPKVDSIAWGNFVKGADGLLIYQIPGKVVRSTPKIAIAGIVEIKSMALSTSRIVKQINHHRDRLQGGLELCGEEWTQGNILVQNHRRVNFQMFNLFRIMVIPSSWKLNRQWYQKDTATGWKMEFPEQIPPTRENEIREIESGLFKITLSWSEDALNEAAYEMTFWCMSEVWIKIFKEKPWPKEWENMSPEEAGYNAIKMMLYYIPLRYISKRQHRLSIKLYNIYCYGYPLGAESKEMLWSKMGKVI